LCILIVCKPGATLPREHLLGSIENNPNGAGYAIHKGDSLFVERGLNDLELVDSFLANRTQWPEGPAMFHARIASAGDVTDANCHPFQVGEHNDIVLAHNGAMLPLKGYGPFMADNSKSRYTSRRMASMVRLQQGSCLERVTIAHPARLYLRAG
jgi:predicted glutamine amidotransferase